MGKAKMLEGKGKGKRKGKREREGGKKGGKEVRLPVTEIPRNKRIYPREYLQNLLFFYCLLEMPLRIMVIFLLGGLLNLIHFLHHCI